MVSGPTPVVENVWRERVQTTDRDGSQDEGGPDMVIITISTDLHPREEHTFARMKKLSGRPERFGDTTT